MRESKTLCGEWYGCTAINEGAVGEVFECYGALIPCGSCVSIAKEFVQAIIGTTIEFCSFLGESGEWVKSSEKQERLEELLLYQALKPQMAALKAMQ